MLKEIVRKGWVGVVGGWRGPTYLLITFNKISNCSFYSIESLKQVMVTISEKRIEGFCLENILKLQITKIKIIIE